MTSLARATAVMSLGTVLSRITGLARLGAIAATLGVAESLLPDTYNLANTIPVMINELVLGGVLTSVFVPVFVELLEKEGRERAWEVASALINLVVVVLTAIAALAVVAAPWIAKVYVIRRGGGAAAELQEETLTFLLRLFAPQVIFYGLTAVTAGLLNAHKRFGAPMYTPILNNLAVIAVFMAFYRVRGPVTMGSATTGDLLVIGIGTTAGVALMAFAQLPFLRGLGRYRWSLSVRHPSVRKLARLSVFVVGYVVTNQVGYLIVQWLAYARQGGYSAYVNAYAFFMLPHGLFAVSVLTALLPGMSEHAVNRRWDEFRDRLSTGVRATLLLVLPAAIGYLVLAEEVVAVLLQRGIMTGASTDLVAGVLRFFVLGLVPFSVFQLFQRAFYAMHDTRTPFLINCGAVALNVAVNIPMFAVLGPRGLAAGHALSYVFGVTAQARVLSRRIGGLDGARIAGSAARIAAAAAGMGAVVWATFDALSGAVETSATSGRVVVVVVPVAVGIVAYASLAWLLRVEELSLVRGILARRPR